MRFIADSMLGKLTRWLRMLGQNVKYSSSLSDKQLIEISKRERRILLTRDLELYQQAMKRGVDSILVEGTTEAEKLSCLARQFNLKLEIDITVSRCPKCNTRIKSIPKDKVVNRVLEATFKNYKEFWECPNCGQVYWQGAHWSRIEKTLVQVWEMTFGSSSS